MAKKKVTEAPASAPASAGRGVEPAPIEYLDPAVLLMDDNARFELKETRIESLMKDIKEAGEVRVPLRVSPLPQAIDGKLFRVNEGHYRTAASQTLKQQDTAFTDFVVPCYIESETMDPSVRLLNQLRENIQRESLTPMDTAVAIKKLMDIGKSRTEIREIFTRPGGRKGLKNQMASNSFLNMHLKFLEFPKGIQERIHDGRITVAGAYILSKADKADWDEIVTRLDDARQKEIDREEADEEKLTKEEAKIQEASVKQRKIEENALKVKADLQTVEARVTEAKTVAKQKYEAYVETKDPAEKKKMMEGWKSAQADAEALQKKEEALQKEAEKQQALVDKSRKQAQEKSKELAEKRKETQKGAGPKEVHKAAAAAGVSAGGTVTLNRSDILDALATLTKSTHPSVKAIGGFMLMMCSGKATPKQIISTLSQYFGDVTSTKEGMGMYAPVK